MKQFFFFILNKGYGEYHSYVRFMFLLYCP